MKKIFLLVIVILIVLLTSCSIGGTQLKNFFGDDNKEGKFFYTSSQLGRYSDNDNQTANDRLEQLLDALKNKDKTAVKSMFSQKALSEAENFDSNLGYLLEFFQGDIQKWDKCYPATTKENERGHIIKKSEWWTYVYTDKEEYIFIAIDYLKDTDHPDNVGLYTLRVIKAKDRNTSQFDWTELPGVYCPKDS